MEEKKLYNAVRKTITLADGREIMIETGKLAKQADGSVVVPEVLRKYLGGLEVLEKKNF